MRARKVSKSKTASRKKKGFFADKRKVGLIFVGFFLIVLMVGSMLIAGDEQQGEEYNYNGYYFIQLDGYWKMVSEDASFYFLNDPLSLENVTVEVIDLDVEKVYVAFEPGKNNLGSEGMSRLLPLMKSVVPLALPACFSEEGCSDLPIVSCGGEDKIVWLKQGEVEKIYNQDSCIVLQYEFSEMKILDLFIYKLLGVM